MNLYQSFYREVVHEAGPVVAVLDASVRHDRRHDNWLRHKCFNHTGLGVYVMSKAQYDWDNRKQFTVLSTIAEHGKSRMLIECPHCDSEFWAFKWSLCGGGKKCPDCGALHGSSGMAAKEKGNE